MPDPKPHLDANGFVILDDPEPDDHATPAHLAPDAIAACELCDPDGYRGMHVCDHQEHSTAEGRQAAREAVRAALAKGGDA